MHEKKTLDSGGMVIDSPSGRFVDAMDVGSGVPYPDLENESSPKAYYEFLFSDDAAIRTEALRREIAFLRYLFLGAGITAFDQLDVLRSAPASVSTSSRWRVSTCGGRSDSSSGRVRWSGGRAGAARCRPRSGTGSR